MEDLEPRNRVIRENEPKRQWCCGRRAHWNLGVRSGSFSGNDKEQDNRVGTWGGVKKTSLELSGLSGGWLVHVDASATNNDATVRWRGRK